MNQSHASILIAADGVISCEGLWTVSHLETVERRLSGLSWPDAPDLVVEGSGIHAMDTGGAWLLQRTLDRLRQEGRRVTVRGLPPAAAGLVDMVAGTRVESEPAPAAPRVGFLERIGQWAWDRLPQAMSALTFLGEGLMAGLLLVRHPRAIRWRSLWRNIQIDGFNALPITGLLTFLMGIVIAYQGAEQLRTVGANIFIVDLVGISMLREISPLVTAILVAGRSGSAYTAQIGTMQVTEELDAIRTLGISPMALLVLPRMLALVIALPLLTVYSDVVGVFGGMLIASGELGVSFTEFVSRFEQAVALKHYLIGIGKAPVFAVTIALVGCYQGFQIRGGVESVGRRTTTSVVQGIFLVIVFDAFFSVLFSWWGI
jgi:phospholipid/cholesterol/gamma-HCH transport system permease protein